jgi:hypothetical protein
MQFTRFSIKMIAIGAVSTPLIAETTVLTDRDYMTSGFFSMDPAVRGDNDGRAVNRVSSIQPFGVFQENTYLEFNDNDWSAFGGPVDSAIFRIEVVSGGFGADSDSETPFDISVHSVTQDPWTTIDPSLFTGVGSYQDFVNNELTSGSVVSTTTVAGNGVYEWDITALVNDWITNGDANFAQTIALSGILDTSGGTFLQGLVNSTNPGLTGAETLGQIVIVPAPAGMISFAAFGIIATRRRRG